MNKAGIDCISVRVPPSMSIGDVIAKALSGAQEATKGDAKLHVIAVVPRMLTWFGQSPIRYEVTEADVLIEWRPL